jgi:hypothetical protein
LTQKNKPVKASGVSGCQKPVLAKKQAAYAQYRETRDSMRELLTVKANIDMVTDRHAPARNTKDREIAR